MRGLISIQVPNLDDEIERDNFLAFIGVREGRELANWLGLRGRGSVRVAMDLRAYARNRQVAHEQRSAGFVDVALKYEAICERVYRDLPRGVRW